ncbi:MAG: hypothetical protein MUF25_00420, partial [Pirellulaceae bacterium]|nr:hypothetical protein [Pirellulaceae bacterium]
SAGGRGEAADNRSGAQENVAPADVLRPADVARRSDAKQLLPARGAIVKAAHTDATPSAIATPLQPVQGAGSQQFGEIALALDRLPYPYSGP